MHDDCTSVFVYPYSTATRTFFSCEYLYCSIILVLQRHVVELECPIWNMSIVFVCSAASGEPRVDPVERERGGHRVPGVHRRRRRRWQLLVEAQLERALAPLAERGARLRRRTQLQRRRLGAHHRERRRRRRRQLHVHVHARRRWHSYQ